MERKFYEIIPTDDGGVLYALSSAGYVALDAEKIEDWESLVFELKDGPYSHYNTCVGNARIVSAEFKNLILSVVGSNSYLDFFPVRIVSQEYGDKEYYIMHFTKIFDVIDIKHTIYFNIKDKEHVGFLSDKDTILKMKLNYEKVRYLQVFNSQPYVNDLIVSEVMKKAIINNKLNKGIEFSPIYCGENE